MMTPAEFELRQAEHYAEVMRERADQRRREEGRKAALAGPDAGAILDLEQRRDRLRQEQLDMMRICGLEGRTLDYEESARYDWLSLERADLAHQIAKLQAKYMPPLP